jgi:hypothetical protein
MAAITEPRHLTHELRKALAAARYSGRVGEMAPGRAEVSGAMPRVP